MDQEKRAIREEIAETRGELGDAVSELSERLEPRRQAQHAVGAGRDAVLERLRGLSSGDFEAALARARRAVQANPRGAFAVGALAVLLAGRRRRRRS